MQPAPTNERLMEWPELINLIRPITTRFRSLLQHNPQVDEDDLVNYALYKVYNKWPDGKGNGILIDLSVHKKGFVATVAYHAMIDRLHTVFAVRNGNPGKVPETPLTSLDKQVKYENATKAELIPDESPYVDYAQQLEDNDTIQRKVSKLDPKAQSVARALLNGKQQQDNDMGLDRSASSRAYKRALSQLKSDTECDLCGNEMQDKSCKLRCPQCGYIRDCTDY